MPANAEELLSRIWYEQIVRLLWRLGEKRMIEAVIDAAKVRMTYIPQGRSPHGSVSRVPHRVEL